MGSPSAKVALIEFSDYQCPYCGTFERETLPVIITEYVDTGRVRLVFKHFPIQQIHPRAMRAAEAAECARRQGRFWQLHRLLFENQHALDESTLLNHAKVAGLDRGLFSACLTGDATDAVRRDVEQSKLLGLRGTPGFLIGMIDSDSKVRPVTRVSGAKPLTVFRESLDAALGSQR
jgi:protein-disulfide isomerase